jgi:hypothetical protein
MIALLSLGALALWACLATARAIATDDYRRLPDRTGR